MLSAFPAMMSADGFFGNPFPAIEGGFSSTLWECQEPLFVFPQPDDEPILSPLDPPPQEPILSDSGSPNSNSNSNPLAPLDSPSGSNDPDQSLNNNSSSSASDDLANPPVDSSTPTALAVIDERKRRRMLSNRDSARRSRMRKQKHLENLRNQVTRLKSGNRELMNRLRVVTHHCQLVRSDNDRLQSESLILRRRLWDICQLSLVRQLQQQLVAPTIPATSAWPCNNNFLTSMNDETTIPLSLIT